MTARRYAPHGFALRGVFGRVGRRSWLARVVVLGLAAAQLAWSAPARALETPPIEDGNEEYLRTMELAVERFRERDFDRARGLFAAAHALEPSARTLRGLGLTDFEAGRYALAIEELEAALVHPVKPLDPPQRAEVEAVLSHARAFVGTLRIERNPRHATVTLDDRPVTSDALQLDAGSYVLRAQAPGFDPLEQHVQVQPAEITLATVSLEPSAPEPTQPLLTQVAVDDTQRTAAWIVGSLGVAGVIVGSVFGVRSIVKHNESDRYCSTGRLCSDIRGVTAMEDARTAGDLSTVGFVVGGLALGVATVLLVTAPDDGSEGYETALGPRLGLGPGTFVLQGAF